MKTVILCGGYGTRIRDVADDIPKPMIPIGSKPIIWHIMKTYASYGYNNFILCMGYKSEVIKDFFINYEMRSSDVTIKLGAKSEQLISDPNHDEDGWEITLAETGLKTMTGARIRKIRKYIGDDPMFMLTYGDGVGDIDIDALVAFHKSHGKMVTLTGVRPPGRFGELGIAEDGSTITGFNEKPQASGGRINGGYFVCNREFFEILSDDDDLVLEQEPMKKLVELGELKVFEHDGFWQPMDTSREYSLLNELYNNNQAPWVKWTKKVMFGNVYHGKKVLVTGNTGFKGSWLCTWLLSLGADVYGISNEIPTSPSMFVELGLDNKMKHFFADVRDLKAIEKIINEIEPEFVFHLAAQPIVSLSYSEPIDTISTNVMGTANVLEVLRSYKKPCTAVIITSDKCYDNVEWIYGYKETDAVGGKDIYSGSKGAAELIFKSYYHSFFKKDEGLVKIASARAGNVIGGGDWALDRIIPDCMRSWSLGKVVEIRSPKAARPWQHVLEPLSGYLQLGQRLYNDHSLNGESFNFGPKPEYNHTVQEILEDMSVRWHFENSKDAYQVTGDIKFYEAGLLKLNCDKALFHFQWKPTLDYITLIEYTSDWYYKFYKNETDMFAYTQSQINGYENLATLGKISWTK